MCYHCKLRKIDSKFKIIKTDKFSNKICHVTGLRTQTHYDTTELYSSKVNKLVKQKMKQL